MSSTLPSLSFIHVVGYRVSPNQAERAHRRQPQLKPPAVVRSSPPTVSELPHLLLIPFPCHGPGAGVVWPLTSSGLLLLGCEAMPGPSARARSQLCRFTRDNGPLVPDPSGTDRSDSPSNCQVRNSHAVPACASLDGDCNYSRGDACHGFG